MTAINLSEMAERIQMILQGCVGRENAMKRGTLLDKLMAIDSLTTDRQMRKAIEKCIPWVCTGSGGYYIAKTDAEISRTVHYLDKKIHGLYARRRAILEAHPKVGPRQLELR